MSDKYKNLKVKELQELLQKNNLPYSGKKEDLVDRLVKNDERKVLESLEKEFELDDDLDDSKINLNDIPQDIFTPISLEKPVPAAVKESVLSDDEEVEFIISRKPQVTAATPKEKPSTTVAAAASVTKLDEKPVKSLSTSSMATTSDSKPVSNETTATATATATTSFKFTPITFDKKQKVNTTTTTKNTLKVADPEKKKIATPKEKVATPQLDEATEKLRLEAERRLIRSKRFGVKLDEKEMKEIRAARFGIINNAATTTKTNTTAAETTGEKTTKVKKAENGKASNKLSTQEEILKKRAERFGLPLVKVKQAIANEAKKTKSKKINKKMVEPEVKKKNVVHNNVKGKPVKVTKNAVKITPSVGNKKKAITFQTPTRSSLLKQKAVNKMLEKDNITKDKKKIIHQRKVNLMNNRNNVTANQGGRIITYEVNATASDKKRNNNAKSTNTKTPARNVIIHHNNDRKVAIADSVPQKTRSRNSNNSATRKRGRGFEQPPLQTSETHSNKRRRR